MKKTLFWFLSFLIAASFAVFQRMTGPTYPVKGSTLLPDNKYRVFYLFPRSCTLDGIGCPVKVEIQPKSKCPMGGGILRWKRFKTSDNWSIAANFVLPNQPPAGKVEYQVVYTLGDNNNFGIPTGSTHKGCSSLKQGQNEYPKEIIIGPERTVARFKGPVPGWILIPHIVLMFLFMLFSTRIFLTAFTGDIVIKHAVAMNFVFLLLGGFVFGPLTQYHAFGQYWTGWPLGRDLTDTKILPMLVFWAAALWAAFKAKNPRPWFIAAFAVTVLVYLVPHSMFGSELDYSTGAVVTGK